MNPDNTIEELEEYLDCLDLAREDNEMSQLAYESERDYTMKLILEAKARIATRNAFRFGRM